MLMCWIAFKVGSGLAQGLSQYGNGFLAKFEAAACPNQLLEEVTLVDTPGVLSGEKQRIEVNPMLPICLNAFAPVRS